MLLITSREYEFKPMKKVYGLEFEYIPFFEKYNIFPITLPVNTNNIDFYFDAIPITHIVLSGGNDICPESYGQKAQFVSGCSEERDEMEKKVLQYAVINKIPVMGICRGMQFINVFFGGLLIQNIGEQIQDYSHPPNLNHAIKIVDPEVLAGKYLEKFEVNSFHNQAVITGMLSNELKPFAKTLDDQIIEGLFHPYLPIAGVQWHPERNREIGKLDDYLFRAFIKKQLFWEK